MSVLQLQAVFCQPGLRLNGTYTYLVIEDPIRSPSEIFRKRIMSITPYQNILVSKVFKGDCSLFSRSPEEGLLPD